VCTRYAPRHAAGMTAGAPHDHASGVPGSGSPRGLAAPSKARARPRMSAGTPRGAHVEEHAGDGRPAATRRREGGCVGRDRNGPDRLVQSLGAAARERDVGPSPAGAEGHAERLHVGPNSRGTPGARRVRYGQRRTSTTRLAATCPVPAHRTLTQPSHSRVSASTTVFRGP
jgi:hypothetical protein